MTVMIKTGYVAQMRFSAIDGKGDVLRETNIAEACHRHLHEVLLKKYVRVGSIYLTKYEKIRRTINMDRHVSVMTIGLTKFSSLDVYTTGACKEPSGGAISRPEEHEITAKKANNDDKVPVLWRLLR
jgi:hypothetical protein